MAVFPTLRQLRRTLGPRWLTDGEGELVGYSLDLIKDGFLQRLYQGHLARFPQNSPDGSVTAPSDALTAMGRDRRVVRGIGETEASYAARLVNWLDDRRTAGNPYTLMKTLAAYTGAGTSFRTVDVRGNWYSRAADGTQTAVLAQGNWNWDGGADRWSRFWVIVYPSASLWTATGNAWGDSACQAWGDAGHTWGSTALPDQVATMRFLVNDWKPAGTRCVNIIAAFDASSFNPASPEPDGLWARSSKTVNGVRVASRLSTARYWDGV